MLAIAMPLYKLVSYNLLSKDLLELYTNGSYYYDMNIDYSQFPCYITPFVFGYKMQQLFEDDYM